MPSGFGLLVNETRLIAVVVKDSAGRVLTDVTPIFTSSDTSIATVNSTGVMLARWPGTARIDVTVASIKGSVTANITSRLFIGLEQITHWGTVIELAVGDTVRLRPYVRDANGHALDFNPTVTWSSTNPDGIAVDSRGKITALQNGATAEIRAVGQEGVGIENVRVSVPTAGPPAILRVAHAASGIGPVTFVPSKGDARTVGAGESATLQVPPGILLVQAQRTPNPFSEYPSVEGVSIKPGEKVTLYVMGIPGLVLLKWVWASSATIAADKAAVTVIQGMRGWPVIYIQQAGQGLLDPPASCYFDPLDPAEWLGPPGPVDLLLLSKYPSRQIRSQLRVEAKAGTMTTVILSGSPENGMTHFSFPDL
jgi:hypothetical protein